MSTLSKLAEETFLNHYHVFLRLALSFTPQIPFKPGDNILDVGCRNGKATGAIASANPDCRFKALTTSPRYLEAINKDSTLQSLSNVSFELADLYDLDEKPTFDKVVSFSCLTWFEHKDKILKPIFNALKPGGQAYIQLFVDHGQDWFDKCLFTVANKEAWIQYFGQFKKRVTHTKPGALLAQAEQLGFITQYSHLHKRRIPVENETHFKNWMITWSSHLAYLPENKVDAFFSEALETYLLDHPKDNDGTLYYEDYFLEIILKKPGN